MTTSEAMLLAADALDDRCSSRSLEDVGVDTVLGAMIEQRKRSSRPAPCEVAAGEDEAGAEQAPRRAPAHSDAFLKAR
jgi:hypothetical protein